MLPRVLTFDDFAPMRGKPFSVQVQNGTFQLVLVEAQELPGSVRSGGGFRLEFHGPAQPALGQGVYRFLIGGQPNDIFLVPLGAIADKMRYEAIFF